MQPDIRVIESPQPIVTIGEARKHIIELPAEDEAYVESLILAATTWIDGPTGWIGRALGVQTLEYSLCDFWSYQIELPYLPAIDVVSVVYRNDAGADITIPAEEYQLWGGIIQPVGAWPSVADRPEAVKIRYRAGYGRLDDGSPSVLKNDVPAPIKIAVLMLVAQWYQTREPVVIGATVEKLPFAVEALLHPYRVYR